MAVAQNVIVNAAHIASPAHQIMYIVHCTALFHRNSLIFMRRIRREKNPNWIRNTITICKMICLDGRIRAKYSGIAANSVHLSSFRCSDFIILI